MVWSPFSSRVVELVGNSALDVYLYTTMRYINRRFTYLLTYLKTQYPILLHMASMWVNSDLENCLIMTDFKSRLLFCKCFHSDDINLKHIGWHDNCPLNKPCGFQHKMRLAALYVFRLSCSFVSWSWLMYGVFNIHLIARFALVESDFVDHQKPEK